MIFTVALPKNALLVHQFHTGIIICCYYIFQDGGHGYLNHPRRLEWWSLSLCRVWLWSVQCLIQLSVAWKVWYFARLAWKYLLTPPNLGFFEELGSLNGKQYQRHSRKVLSISTRRLRHTQKSVDWSDLYRGFLKNRYRYAVFLNRCFCVRCHFDWCCCLHCLYCKGWPIQINKKYFHYISRFHLLLQKPLCTNLHQIWHSCRGCWRNHLWQNLWRSVIDG